MDISASQAIIFANSSQLTEFDQGLRIRITFVISVYILGVKELKSSSYLVPDAPPTNVSVSVVNATTAEMTWGPIPQDNRRGDIIGYQILYFPTETTDISEVSASGAACMSQLIAGLKPYTNYSAAVSGHTSQGGGPYSVYLNFTTDMAGKTFLHNLFSYSQFPNKIR